MRIAAVSALCAALLALAGPADAFDSCSYDAASRTATATVAYSYESWLSVGAGGEVLADGSPCGEATTANTDLVRAVGSGEGDRMWIYEDGPGGPFAKPGTDHDVHFDIELGKSVHCDPPYGCADVPQFLTVVGSPGADDISAGRDGATLLVNLDGSDGDADVRVTGPVEPELELDGGAGPDRLTGIGGAAGADPTNVTLRGDAGDDELVTAGSADLIYPGPGADTVNASPSGRDLVSYEDAPGPVTAELGSGKVPADGFGGHDRLDTDARRLRTGAFADRVTVRSFAPGFSGGVRVETGDGDDVVIGSEHSDRIEGGGGDDRLSAGVDYGYSGDLIDGGPGRDVVRGSGRADELRGGKGDDIITGLAGNSTPPRGNEGYDIGDRLVGGPGSDFLDGGRDRDTYVFGPTWAHEVDTISEAPRHGRDMLEFTYYDSYYTNFPIGETRVDLTSRARLFGKNVRRTLRTLDPGGAREIEDFWDDGPGTDRVVGNDASNLIHLSQGDGNAADCRGGRDKVFASSASTLKHCERVVTYD